MHVRGQRLKFDLWREERQMSIADVARWVTIPGDKPLTPAAVRLWFRFKRRPRPATIAWIKQLTLDAITDDDWPLVPSPKRRRPR